MPRSQGTSRKGKPKKNERASGMGRALERSQQRRFKPKSNGSSRGAGMAMAPDTTNIGLDDDPTKTMKSVLEVEDLADFLGQAEMAGREFESEREQFIVLDSTGTEYKHAQTQQGQSASNEFVFQELSVPRRPPWDSSTTPADLDQMEKDSFLGWRRSIAEREEELAAQVGDSAHVTPFEKNLEVWKQLWRVLERSNVVIQIVDGRNPLFFLSSDLRKYAQEELGKPMMVVINKSDYLTERQRKVWHEYLKGHGWNHLFFSAYEEQKKLDDLAAAGRRGEDLDVNQRPIPDEHENGNYAEGNRNDEARSQSQAAEEKETGVTNPLTRTELLSKLRDFAIRQKCRPDLRYENRVQFGMVGFPNVGKSSVINVLVGSSKNSHGLVRVGVAAQPGKTKHFQTLLLPDADDLMLCDCPGLVFPSFVSSSADLIAAGVYPIAQMRDFWPVVSLICQRIPREVLNVQYGIRLPEPTVQDLRERGLVSAADETAGHSGSTVTGMGGVVLPPPTAEELLGTYCIARSLLAPASGVPDYQRAARVIIKDYVEGKLLYCHGPPDLGGKMCDHDFQRETLLTAFRNTKKLQEKFGSVLQQQEQQQHGHKSDGHESSSLEMVAECNDNAIQSAEFDGRGIEDDIDILNAVDGFVAEKSGSSEVPGGKRGKKHKSIKKHGKKGRKDRNKDPYGCHSDVGVDVISSSGGGSGVVVNAGKYSRNGYTRANYAGARSAVPF